MNIPLAEFYARNRERNDIATAEWNARQPFGRFEVSDRVDEWAQGIVEGTPLERLSLTPKTARQWAPLLTAEVTDNHGDPLWWVLNASVGRAVDEGILLPPEPGIVRTSYAHRNQDDSTSGIGWGFVPTASQFLVVNAASAVDIDEVAGGRDVVGGASIVQLIQRAAGALNQPKNGPARSD